MPTPALSHTIASLNDAFRRTLRGGRILFSRGVAALPESDQRALLEAVSTFDDFTPDNDPHGEHDFGAIQHRGLKFFWKIDYYDTKIEFGSENPADPTQTTRVLTILLAEEY